MERITSNGNFITRNLFLITVSCFYLLAAAGPVWGLGWDSPFLAPWAACLLALLLAGGWRYMRPGRQYPGADLSFIVPVILSVNLFAVLLGDGGEWVRPMNYLLVALCALYYSVWFNFAVAGLVFVLELAGVFFSPGDAGARASVGLGVYGAYLACIPLVLGRLFHFEHKKKEHAIREYRRLTEGAQAIKPAQAESESIRSISEESRKADDIDATASLDRGLAAVLEAARYATRARNVALFMPGGAGSETVSLRLAAGEGPFNDGAAVVSGQGLVGWVVKEKKALLAGDRAAGLDYLDKKVSTGSFAAVPVIEDGRLEGVLAADSEQREAFADADKETLESFCEVVLHMLRDARAFRAVGLAAENSKALHTVSKQISTSLDLKTVLEKLSSLIRDVVPYDYLTISFLEDEGAASFKVVEGYLGAAPEGPVPLRNSYLDWIVKNRAKLAFNDFNRSTAKMPIFPAKGLQADFRSFLGMPLISRNKVLGVLTVALRRAGGIDAYQQDMLGIIADQVAAHIANARLHHTIKLMATTDGLTGLINHRHFQEKADERFARASRYPEDISLLLFDIDHFKKVNDTYGHPVGDAVLKKVAAIVRETARTVDVAARYGGEEFAVIMENTGEPGAMKMAERIRSSIQKTKFVFEGNTVPVTVSIGCSSYPSGASDKKELIDRADKALYWAKRNGRNRCCAYNSIAGEAGISAKNN